MATIIIFAILGLIAPLLGLSIDMKEEGSKLNKVEALIIGLPVAIIAAVTAYIGKPLIVAIVLILVGILQFLPIFKKDRSMYYLFTAIVFTALLITLMVQNWTGISYWLALYVFAGLFPITTAITRNAAANAAAEAEPNEDTDTGSYTAISIVVTAVATLIALLVVLINTSSFSFGGSKTTADTTDSSQETPAAEASVLYPTTAEAAELPAEADEAEATDVIYNTAEAEADPTEMEINLSGQRQGASVSTLSEDEVEGALTVDLNKIALYGNQYESYSRLFSDNGEESMPTQANWDRKTADLKYAMEKKFISNTWQDAPVFMPTYVKDALTADGVKGLDTLAKYLNEHHKEDMKEDVIRQIKANPVYGMMWDDALIQIELTTGKTLGDLNEWMVRAHDRNEEFRAVPYGQHPRGNEGWLEAYIDEAGNKKIRTTDEYDEFATKLLILIFDCFSDEIGIDRYQSKIMYGLEANMDGDLIQCERLEKGEDYPGLMLKYDRKDADREILLKVNIWDLRLEICDRKQKSVAEVKKAEAKKKVNPVKVTPVNPVPVTPVTPIGVTPVNPTPVTPDPGTPTPPPTPSNPQKDPSQDPGNRGNAPDGSGQNDDKGPGTYQPSDPGWSAPVVTDPGSGSGGGNSGGNNDSGNNSGGGDSHKDENKPDDKPTETHDDSHDNGGSGAGDGNGEFSM